MITLLSEPWAWYISGPLLAVVMFLLLWVGGEFGVSSTLRTFCAMGGAGKKIGFFNFNWKNQWWNIVFVLGAAIGGYIANTFLTTPSPLQLSANTIADLAAINISFDGKLAPETIFNWANVATLQGLIVLVGGGFLVGFGARWAGGCTSGHAISGLSNLQLASLVAVIGFFIGGLTMTHFIFPFIF